MTSQKHQSWKNVIYGAAALLSLFGLGMTLTQLAQAQTYRELYHFNQQYSGGGTLVIDPAGDFYGTSVPSGGFYGSVYKLARYGFNYVLNPIYSFQGGNDGSNPYAPVTIGRDGSLYGTASFGGYHGEHCDPSGCGLVYRLRPPATSPPSPFTPWTESVVYAFAGLPNDGYQPFSNLITDAAGNLYGTTYLGGPNLFGIVFELSPSNGGWTEKILYGFSYGDDGMQLVGGVIMDRAGNLYGVTQAGGSFGDGVVYELSPSPNGWQETVLHAFDGSDGRRPAAGLVLDQAGNVYGSTPFGGSNDGGVVFELSPSNGAWTYRILYTFSGESGGPTVALAIDAAGNLYGTSSGDGAYQDGMVFKLSQADGIWTFTDLHDFSGPAFPSGVTLDPSGNLFGTTDAVAWEITP